MSLSKEQWEAKFGGGRKIRWGNEGCEVVFSHWEEVFNDRCFRDIEDSLRVYKLADGTNFWQVVEEPTPTIEEKTQEIILQNGQSFQSELGFTLHNYGGHLLRFSVYDETPQKVDVEDLKRRSYLV